MVVSEDGFGKKPETLPAPFLSGIKYEHLVAGMTGGVISTLVTHPFDLIKLRFAGTFMGTVSIMLVALALEHDLNCSGYLSSRPDTSLLMEGWRAMLGLQGHRHGNVTLQNGVAESDCVRPLPLSSRWHGDEGATQIPRAAACYENHFQGGRVPGALQG